MAKFAGMGMGLAIDSAAGSPVAVSDYVGDITVTNSFGEQDVTPVSAFAMDRLQLVEDATISISGQGFPDDAIMELFTTTPRLPAAGRTVTVTYPNDWSYTFEAKIFSFSPARPQNAGITWSAELRLVGGSPGTWSHT